MTIRVVSNLRRFDSEFASEIQFASLHEPGAGRVGRIARIIRECYRADVVFIDASPRQTLEFCVARALLPGARCRIICADPMLNKPVGRGQRLRAALKRLLFGQVSRFVLLQKDYSGYRRYYGMDPDRVRYVPFKVNQLERILETPTTDDGYFFACGVTHRDWDTLAKAWKGSANPLIISVPDDAELERWGMHTRLPRREAFGDNVTIVRNTSDEWLAMLAASRALILPINPDGINPSGISTYLAAFAMRKPVIISESPSTAGILTEDLARVVPAGDAGALRRAVEELNADADLRDRIGANAYEYALQCGDTRRLNTDYLGIIFEMVGPPHPPIGV